MSCRTRPATTALVAAALLAATNATADPDDRELEEITITAQKFTQTQQSAATAITVLSGDFLASAGVHDLRSAQNLIPSVRFQAENASTEIYVRGVGSTLDLPNIDPPTSFHFNGIYIPREGTSVGFFDIEQLELLPGPQGTLYGRSSLGGAVHVTFNRPTQVDEARGLIEVGDRSLLHATLVRNLPLDERHALRGAVDWVTRDGYLATGADGADDVSVRLSGLHSPREAVELYWWMGWTDRAGAAPNLVRRGYNGGRFDGDPSAFDNPDPWDDRIRPGAPAAGEQRYENLVAGAEFTVNLAGNSTLTWVPGWFDLDWRNDYWLEDIPALLSARYSQITNELRLASDPGARWQWLAGLYHYRMTNSGDFIVGGFPLTQIARNRLEGHAAFGQSTWSISERLRATLGARASFDAREGRGTSAFGLPFAADGDYDHVDWKAGVEIEVANDSMLYATVQTGYQPGTYNPFPDTPARSNRVAPAKLLAYTVGTKNRFFDGRLQANLELFRYDYRDLFVQSFNLNTALLTTFNAARTDIDGAQFDLQFLPGAANRVNLSIGYLDASFEVFTVPTDIDIGTPVRDYAGSPLQYAPEWTVSLGYQHDVPLGRGYLRFAADARYESAFWGTFTLARGTRQDAYIKSNASLTWSSNDERWSLGLWMRNIENEAVLAATTTGQFGPYADAFIEPPRTWGARATFRY